MLGGNQTVILGGTKTTGKNPIQFAQEMEKMGAGELIIQSIDKDGKMEGYDLELIRSISDAVSIPVVALGGAGSLNDLKKGYSSGKATGLAAGSLFVYHGKMNGVLINYPESNEIQF